MNVKESLRNLARRSIRLCAPMAESELRQYRNVDLVLSAQLREAGALIRDPVAYVDFLRGCIECQPHNVTVAKEDSDSADRASRRFNILIESLRRGLPAVDFCVAKELALLADDSRAHLALNLPDGWIADLGYYFSISSSFGKKGQILFNLVRLMRSKNALELGTAFGMSALFILASMKMHSKSAHLTTVECAKPHFSHSSLLLTQRYGEAVKCHLGMTNEILPTIVGSLGSIDFVFHDGAHSRDDYIRDFSQVVEILAPDAVVLFDDIRWENQWSISKGSARTYEGWKSVVDHPRVKRAVEIDGDFGLLLIGPPL